jgi:hypothetical protein
MVSLFARIMLAFLLVFGTVLTPGTVATAVDGGGALGQDISTTRQDETNASAMPATEDIAADVLTPSGGATTGDEPTNVSATDGVAADVTDSTPTDEDATDGAPMDASATTDNTPTDDEAADEDVTDGIAAGATDDTPTDASAADDVATGDEAANVGTDGADDEAADADAGNLTTMDDPETPEPPEAIDGVYQLATADDLRWFATFAATTPNANAKLTANINVPGQDWVPIGGTATYTGSFDGNGKVITINAKVTNNTYLRFGLFGNVGAGALIKNVTVAGSITTATTSSLTIGGIAGRMTGGTLQDVTNRAAITSNGTNTGGIVATVSGASVITGATNLARVTATSLSNATYLGGIVAMMSGTGVLSSCTNEGVVSGGINFMGGIVGQAMGGTIVDNTNRGMVRSTYIAAPYVGGIAGFVLNVSNFSNNTSNGIVSFTFTDGSYVGAVIGYCSITMDKTTGNLYLAGTAERGFGSSTYAPTEENVKATLPADTTALVLKKTDPVKTIYQAGQRFDVTGFTAVLVASDSETGGITETIIGTESVVNWDKKGPLTPADTEVTLSVTAEGLNEPVAVTVSIEVIEAGTVGMLRVTKQPSKRVYYEGESFDKDDIAVSALYGYTFNEVSRSEEEVIVALDTDQWTFTPAHFSVGDTRVTINYTAPNGSTALVDIWSITVLAKEGAPPQDSDGFFELGSPEQLVWFTGLVVDSPEAKARLTADIDMSDVEWNGIGGYTAQTAYRGIFDGDGHTVTLVISKPSNSYQGLFRYLDGASVRNLTVAGSVRGASSVGGIAAQANNSTLTNVVNTAAVRGSGSIGGIVGLASNGTTIINARNSGAVSTSSGTAGGIVASLGGSSAVLGCVNDGRVASTLEGTASSYGRPVGGIVGTASAGSRIEDNTNNGEVFNPNAAAFYNTAVGGIVGSAQASASARSTVSGNTNRGAVLPVEENVDPRTSIGGVIGNLSGTSVEVVANNRYQYDPAAPRLRGVGVSSATITTEHVRMIPPDGVAGVVIKTSDPAAKRTGAAFDLTGFVATILWADESMTPVDADHITWDNHEPLTAVNRTVVISVDPDIDGVEPVTFTITVSLQSSLTALRISKQPSTKSYLAGESFNKDDPGKFTRPWFAWANALFGQLIVEIAASKPALLAAKI